MGDYRTDQFWNYRDYEGSGSINRKSSDNPNFLYPGPRRHDVFNSPDPAQRNDGDVNTKMQRGFIRGIFPKSLNSATGPTASKAKERRLFFQFNPTTLDRNVAMSSSMLNPLLQDPSNLLTPIPGQASFSFDLLFNREAEVARNSYSNLDDERKKVQNNITSSLESYGTNYSASDVASLGVLADLYVLDSIIGQSITPDMLSFLKAYWNSASTLSQDVFASSGGGASFSYNDKGFTSVVQQNYGNSAFLSPLPVRIVFSSLFMIEGFVQQSWVQFIKFSQSYVPTICKVTLDVRALYVGFAREKAYLTDNLDKAFLDAIKRREDDEKLANTARKFLDDIYFLYYPGMGGREGYTSDTLFIKFSITGTEEIDYPKDTPKHYYGENYETFKDFYNVITMESLRNLYAFSFPFFVRSTITTDLYKAVRDENMTWSFSTTATITATPTGGQSMGNADPITLVTSTFEYFTESGVQGGFRKDKPGTITPEKMVENANNHPYPKDEFRKNWAAFADSPKTKQVTITNDMTITIKLSHTVSINYTDSKGGQSVSSVYDQEYSFNAIDKDAWSKFMSSQYGDNPYKKGGKELRMYPITPR